MLFNTSYYWLLANPLSHATDSGALQYHLHPCSAETIDQVTYAAAVSRNSWEAAFFSVSIFHRAQIALMSPFYCRWRQYRLCLCRCARIRGHHQWFTTDPAATSPSLSPSPAPAAAAGAGLPGLPQDYHLAGGTAPASVTSAWVLLLWTPLCRVWGAERANAYTRQGQRLAARRRCHQVPNAASSARRQGSFGVRGGRLPTVHSH